VKGEIVIARSAPLPEHSTSVHSAKKDTIAARATTTATYSFHPHSKRNAISSLHVLCTALPFLLLFCCWPVAMSAQSILSLNTTSLSFGNVAVNSAATRPLRLTSSGSKPLTIYSATVTGSGFSMPLVSFPFSLNPGQAVTLNIGFEPTSAGAANGRIIIVTNANVGPVAMVSLYGNGTSNGGGAAPGVSSFTVNSTYIPFGNVTVGSSATQSVIVRSTGTSPVTISSAMLVGGNNFASTTYPSLPLTLAPGQTLTGFLQFDPSTAGTSNGTWTIKSNSSKTPSVMVTLTGTGVTATNIAGHEVSLTWDAPRSSSVPITGYHVYRSTASGSYHLLNPAEDTQTTYIDSTVQSGQTYSYYVRSVGSGGVESAPSNSTTVTVP